MNKIGITGVIGSGKSVISHIFEILGIPVYNADYQAKLLMNNNIQIKSQIVMQFGEESYLNGELNSKYIAKKIFKDECERQTINSIVHPVVKNDFLAWSNKQQSNFCAIESALIYEANFEDILEHIIMVKCPEDLLIKRIIERDKIDSTEATKKIRSQRFNFDSNLHPNFIINNNNEESLIVQCIDILKSMES